MKVPHTSESIAPLSTHAPYAAAIKDLEKLTGALGKVETRIAEIEAVLRRDDVPLGQAREESRVSAALAFAESGKVLARATHATMQDEHVELREQRDALNGAIRNRREELDRIADEVSRQVCMRMEPAHRDVAAKCADLLEKLDTLMDEEDAITRQIESAGYRASFSEWVHWPLIGRAGQVSDSPLWYRLRELRAYAQNR